MLARVGSQGARCFALLCFGPGRKMGVVMGSGVGGARVRAHACVRACVGGEGTLLRRKVWVIPENPVSILSGDVTGCEWVDSACIRFNK